MRDDNTTTARALDFPVKSSEKLSAEKLTKSYSKAYFAGLRLFEVFSLLILDGGCSLSQTPNRPTQLEIITKSSHGIHRNKCTLPSLCRWQE